MKIISSNLINNKNLNYEIKINSNEFNKSQVT